MPPIIQPLSKMPRSLAVLTSRSKNRGRTDTVRPLPWGARRQAAPSGASERNRDEPGRTVGLQPHEHGMLAILLGLAESFAHILWGSDLGAANFKDDVAALESMLGG